MKRGISGSGPPPARLGGAAASGRVGRPAASRWLEPPVGRTAAQLGLRPARFRPIQLQHLHHLSGLQLAVLRLGLLVLRRLGPAVLTTSTPDRGHSQWVPPLSGFA